jgi:hypothetical protein
MQRGRLGGIPLPRTFPIRDGGIGSMMVVRLRLFPPGGRERFGGAPCCYCARARPTLSPPPRRGHPRKQKLKINKR